MNEQKVKLSHWIKGMKISCPECDKKLKEPYECSDCDIKLKPFVQMN